MTLPLLLKAFLIFLGAAAGLWILSVVMSRFGTKVAGALASFPLVTAIAILILALQNGGAVAVQAVSAIPLALAFEGASFCLLCILLPYSFSWAVMAGVLVWFALAAAALWYGPPSFFTKLRFFFAPFRCLLLFNGACF